MIKMPLYSSNTPIQKFFIYFCLHLHRPGLLPLLFQPLLSQESFGTFSQTPHGHSVQKKKMPFSTSDHPWVAEIWVSFSFSCCWSFSCCSQEQPGHCLICPYDTPTASSTCSLNSCFITTWFSAQAVLHAHSSMYI